jgi:hypothetical protein
MDIITIHFIFFRRLPYKLQIHQMFYNHNNPVAPSVFRFPHLYKCTVINFILNLKELVADGISPTTTENVYMICFIFQCSKVYVYPLDSAPEMIANHGRNTIPLFLFYH